MLSSVEKQSCSLFRFHGLKFFLKKSDHDVLSFTASLYAHLECCVSLKALGLGDVLAGTQQGRLEQAFLIC